MLSALINLERKRTVAGNKQRSVGLYPRINRTVKGGQYPRSVRNTATRVGTRARLKGVKSWGPAYREGLKGGGENPANKNRWVVPLDPSCVGSRGRPMPRVPSALHVTIWCPTAHPGGGPPEQVRHLMRRGSRSGSPDPGASRVQRGGQPLWSAPALVKRG
jgi:hypothetical protein